MVDMASTDVAKLIHWLDAVRVFKIALKSAKYCIGTSHKPFIGGSTLSDIIHSTEAERTRFACS